MSEGLIAELMQKGVVHDSEIYHGPSYPERWEHTFGLAARLMSIHERARASGLIRTSSLSILYYAVRSISRVSPEPGRRCPCETIRALMRFRTLCPRCAPRPRT